jgi:molybdate transport system ATP-binding protein
MKIVFEKVIAPLPHFDLVVDRELTAGKLALYGPSGAGKTSLIELIAGVRTPASGRFLLDGDIHAEEGRDLRPIRERQIGYVPQDDALFTHLSVEHNLLFSDRAERGALERVASALDLLPLLKRKITALSGGEKKRVAFARAFLSSPRLLLLDEPFTGLDGARKEALLELLRQSAIPYILVTHELSDASALCDEVITLDRGRITSPSANVSG